MEGNINIMTEVFRWEEIRNKIIEQRKNDTVFMQMPSDDRLKIIQEEIRELMGDTLISEDSRFALYNHASQINDYITSQKDICPHCTYVNSETANYCVNCGELLLCRQRQCVISLQKYSDFEQRPTISCTEYLRIKRLAEMSIWEKVLARITRSKTSSFILSTISIVCCFVGVLLFFFHVLETDVWGSIMVSTIITVGCSFYFIFFFFVDIKDLRKEKELYNSDDWVPEHTPDIRIVDKYKDNNSKY